VHILKQFISRFRDSLILTIYIFLASTMMLSSESTIVEGLRSTSLVTIGFLQSRLANVDSYFGLRSENLGLRARNTELAYQNFQLQNAFLENIRLRKLLEFQTSGQRKMIPAIIAGFSPLNLTNGYLLNYRSETPVRKNATVMTADGLVGKIIKHSGNFAICQNLLDPNSKVSVRIQRNRELGIISWGGSKGLILENIPNTINIIKGDVLYTSGMSLSYPENIKVGIISSVQKNEEALFQTIKVKPVVNFNNIEEVVIIQPGTENDI